MAKKKAGLPPRLQKLKKASEGWGYFAGNFEFDDDGAGSSLAWFADKAEPASRFLVFGHEGTGGLYAFWLKTGASLTKAPVVLLGSEGEARLLTSTLDEFLSLLALDLDDLGADDDFAAEPAGSPDHAAFLVWLEEQGLAPPEDPDGLVAAACQAHSGLATFIERAMSGKPLLEETPAPKQAAATELPTDAVLLLNAPRPKVKLGAKSGLEVLVEKGVVTTVFIKPGEVGSRLRPGGFDLLSMRRSELDAKLGAPQRKSESWDRWNRGDVAFHLEYAATGEVRMVTLMWIPALALHLR